MKPGETDSILKEAAAAIGRRDGSAARKLLEPLADGAESLPQTLFLLAQACRIDGDLAGEEHAINRLLQRQPHHLGALIIKGDARGRAGDEDGAANVYQKALAVAGSAHERGETFSPSLSTELRRVSDWLQKYSMDQAQRIDDALSDGGFPPARRSELIGETLALLRGEVPIQLQRPKNLYVPGLPQRTFYERHEFDWIPAVEAYTNAIAAEVEALLDEEGGFAPYIPEGSDRSGGKAPNAHLVGDARWGAFHLLRGGEPVAHNVERCPASMAALAEVPLPSIKGRSAMALFSLLQPGAHIRPHHGLFNYRLIFHLPLIVPANCTLRVGNQIRDWRKGEMLIFDDSMEHEAWNRSDETRVILLFEAWRPEINQADREALTLLLEASHIPVED